MADELKIGIAGLGTVGVGVFKILEEKARLLAKRSGREIKITAVSARSKNKERGINLKNIKWHDDPLALAADENVDVVVELIGGADGIAYDLCKSALENGKSVVTANKALIATHGIELAKIAEGKNVALLFEAAVAGGIPIIKALKEGLAANKISKVTGILNGTCNYILTAMEKDKRSFEDVLKEAQKLGYAEDDPSFDIGGVDSAHKLAIIASIAFGYPVNLDTVYIEGITNVSLEDIKYAQELGYKIRLLGIATDTEHGIEQRVHPCLVPADSPIAGVEGVLNAVAAECDALGPVFFEGAGAGSGPTASAVIADIIDIAGNRISPAFGIPIKQMEKANFADINRRTGEYYIRLTVTDKPGVLSSVTSALSKHNIGVESFLQPASKSGEKADIVIITHETGEEDIRKALKQISKIEYVLETPHVMRTECL